jgi:anti-sigma B factor antagonist
MEMTVERIGEVTRVAPKGNIDSSTAAGFGDSLKGVIVSGRSRLVVDMKDVAYISSAGFRCLLIAEKEAQRAGGHLALCGLAREVHRLFEIGAFTDIFTIGSSVEDCVARLTKSP